MKIYAVIQVFKQYVEKPGPILVMVSIITINLVSM